MALYGDKSSTTNNRMLSVMGPTWMGNTLPKEVVVAPLNQDNSRPGFSRAYGE